MHAYPSTVLPRVGVTLHYCVVLSSMSYFLVTRMSSSDVSDMRAAQAAQRQRSRNISANEILVLDHRTGIPLNVSQDAPALSRVSVPIR